MDDDEIFKEFCEFHGIEDDISEELKERLKDSLEYELFRCCVMLHELAQKVRDSILGGDDDEV